MHPTLRQFENTEYQETRINLGIGVVYRPDDLTGFDVVPLPTHEYTEAVELGARKISHGASLAAQPRRRKAAK